MTARSRQPLAARLPAFPWDSLGPIIERAHAHPDGAIDLTVGSPVDPVAEPIAASLSAHANHPGYPPTLGTPALIDAISQSLHRRYGISALPHNAIVPVVGTKELIAQLPWLLGLGPDHRIAVPAIAYPTYDIAARLCGARAVVAEEVEEIIASDADLVYINSPSNPTGRVRSAAELCEIVAWARETGAIIASDECYLGLDFSGRARSIAHPEVCGGSLDNLIAIHSLSKTSNMASYRAGFIFGEQSAMSEVAEVRKHCGLSLPWAVQHAMVTALNSDEHEQAQHKVYRRRRELLRSSLEAAGLQVDYSEAGLYLWVTQDRSAEETIAAFADLGIITAPGTFYGDNEQCRSHVRLSITASDNAIEEAARRLAGGVGCAPS
ncbi:LL-diaminopimelate aminotransferase [Corynebacterium ciconiae DSM 44920]|uniref:succinyldiaminopimelate transaminase n=1 Tax=Corynebacterium ciconiae TaxID=227319 RepID=UPI0003616650|nr:succinyldiaminopimelate transaminase [Corynebacterium ciconiae]WKD60860.1 LL-diaminopimelate aminotransferase [Corynebacterium ciconiae DSM 44920]